MWPKLTLGILAFTLAACGSQAVSQPAAAPPSPSPTAAQPPSPIVSVPDDPTEAFRDIQTDLGPCAHVSRHQYEVCAAYFYASGLRWAYYRYSRSLAGLVTAKLEDRFWTPARQQLENQTAGWPEDVDTTAPRISILAVDVNLKANSAQLTTRESWLVQQADGPVLFQEIDAVHHITLMRMPSIVLHKWVVTNIR